MSENTGPDAPQNDKPDTAGTDGAGNGENAPDAQPDTNTGVSTDGDVFPREYVESLRKESANYRDRAKQADDKAEALAKRLHTAIVEATGRLENPAELAFDAAHLDDPEALNAALEALLADKPYLAKRRVAGDAGQGDRGSPDTGVNLLGLLGGR
ncbi:hypothetical protein ABQE69_12455 [Mycolicibacillus trivialis]